jgi:DOPA 4,5-dioxygenase
MSSQAPFHAHIYYPTDERPRALVLQETFRATPGVLYVGSLRDAPVGPHPIPQFEIHFPEPALPAVLPLIEASGLTALIHPLTDDDLADHTTLGRWIGAPLDLDLTVLDPPGVNQGVPRFGKTDF